MIQREDSEEPRGISEMLVHVIAGNVRLEELNERVRSMGIEFRRLDISPTHVRFLCILRRTRRVYDTFEYVDIEFVPRVKGEQ